MRSSPGSQLSLAMFLTNALFMSTANAQSESPPQAPWSMADEFYDHEEMARARADVLSENGDVTSLSVIADRLGLQRKKDDDAFVWDINAWFGGDINKLWIKTEGDLSLDAGKIEDAEIQFLWSRAISPFFDVQMGLRQDLEPSSRTHVAVGLLGLAPYWFEVEGAAFVSTDGDLTARIEIEYELLFTQRLILQPRAEFEFSAQDIAERETGSGLTNAEIGLRLRYEIKREFAPYVGMSWQGAFGDTRDFLEAAGGSGRDVVWVAGIRAWY